MKKAISLVVILWILLTTLSGCTNTSQQTKEVKKFKVWVLAPLSGPAANYGEDAANVYKIEADKFNAENSGKLHVDLVIEDSKCDGKDAASATQKLISVDGVQVIAWEICSVATIPAAKIAQANNVVIFSPTASAADVTKVWDYVFRMRNDASLTKKVGDYLNKQWYKKIFTLYENTDYGVGYADGTKANFSGESVSEKFQSDEKDFDILAKKIMNTSDIDAVTFITNSDNNTISLIKALDRQWVLVKFKWKIFGTEITYSDSNYKAVWNLMEWIKIAQLMPLEKMGSTAQKILDGFTSTYEVKSVPVWIVLEAETMNFILDAIKTVWSNGTAIRDYFTSFNANNQRNGYFGKYYFSPERDAAGLDFMMYQVKDGKLVLAE